MKSFPPTSVLKSLGIVTWYVRDAAVALAENIVYIVASPRMDCVRFSFSHQLFFSLELWFSV